MDDASIEEEYEAEVLRQREEFEAEQEAENDEDYDQPPLQLFARQRTSTEGALSDAESDSDAIQQQCLSEFEKEDYVLEPDLVETLGRFFAVGGQPEAVVDRLCAGYTGNAQLVNLTADWLIHMGVSVKDVQTSVEQHCQKLILKRFDPKKADSIFHEQTQGQIDWLPELISHASWRSMIYQLSEQYPDCLMLNFAIKLISDAGYQQEIVSVKTASQQLDVFSGVLCTSIENVLSEGVNFQRAFDELSEICCQSEHTYVFSQAALHKVANETKSPSLKRIVQDLRQHAQEKLEYDVAPIQTALYSSMMDVESSITASLHSMLEKRTLYAADISVLYNAYNANEPPPIELIKDQTLIALLIDAIFNPKTGSKLNPEHKSKYTYLLAYAASVQEIYKKGQRRMHNRDELKTTQQAIEKVHQLCTDKEATMELLAELNTFFQCLRYPVNALGMLHWVKLTVTDADYFQLHTEPTPFHLVLVDEVVNGHPMLHRKVFELLIELFDRDYGDLNHLMQLELRKTLIDRMIHLMSKGYAIPVIDFIHHKWTCQDADMSLIRYFVVETLDIIAPPYSDSFAAAFLPLVEDKMILLGSEMTEERQTAVHEFLQHCK